ncbi:MAG: Gmad2 immunoglobulin-like domain-containing protein [Candidatus Parcubacteria bacterium]|nr:Gmad2 immunoglobulin-like domain-containing protein [Candidatus Parcubacteria bacterium]
MKHIFNIIIIILVIVGAVFILQKPRKAQAPEEQRTLEEIEKMDLIRLDSPRPNDTIKSPLVVKGQARGYWFFEADFPVVLVDWDGLIIATGIARAQGEWMTEEFVPFEVTLDFTVDPNVYSTRGALILRKNNPSDLRQNDDALEIPIIFKK